MSKRLKKEFGEKVAEKRGWHRALSSFAFESWGNSLRENVISPNTLDSPNDF
jgi:hypothetical protein